MAERDAGSYRQDRRRLAGRMASSLKAGAQRMFFGASPDEKKALRVTETPKKVKVGDLDLDRLDRAKFDAPEKVGQTIDLIDIAMGKAPAGPAPGLAGSRPPPPDPEVVARATGRRKAMAEAMAQGGDAPPPEFAVAASAAPRGAVEALALVVAVLALAAAPALRPALRAQRPGLAVAALAARGDARPGAGQDPWGRPWCGPPAAAAAPVATATTAAPAAGYPLGRLRSAGPDGEDDRGADDDLPALTADDARLVQVLAWGPELLAALGVVGLWLAVSLGRLRQPRAGLLRAFLRAAVLASLPAAAGVAALAWLLGAVPAWVVLPPPPPAAVDAARAAAAAVGGLVPLPPGRAVAGAWTFLCLLGAARVVGRRIGV